MNLFCYIQKPQQVFGLNEKFVRSPLTFVVGGLGFYWFNKDGSAAQFFPMTKIEQISYNQDDGWITFHSSYPGKHPEDPPVQLSYLSENVYATEVKQWMEAVKQVCVALVYICCCLLVWYIYVDVISLCVLIWYMCIYTRSYGCVSGGVHWFFCTTHVYYVIWLRFSALRVRQLDFNLTDRLNHRVAVFPRASIVK
jgi:hypothetical protein